MKVIHFTALLLAIMILPSCNTSNQSDKIKVISAEEVTAILAEGALLVDVREPDEVEALAYDLPDVTYLPLSELPKNLDKLPTDRPILLACHSGQRSIKAANLLSENGFKELYNLDGGIKGWQAAGQPVKQPGTVRSNGYSDVHIVGAMRNVMWKGQLGGSINLDTIEDKNGLYGLGPQSYLTGELMINKGVSYLSKVNPDSSMTVEKNFDVAAPFFVYANVTEWDEVMLPANVKTIPELEKFISKRTSGYKRPFTFKLIGKVSTAKIHAQNLRPGTKVSSPQEAHQGQVNYEVKNTEAEVVGFFSTEHQGVFTHHDSFLHMHLITADERMMGHLDEVEIEEMTLYLPRE